MTIRLKAWSIYLLVAIFIPMVSCEGSESGESDSGDTGIADQGGTDIPITDTSNDSAVPEVFSAVVFSDVHFNPFYDQTLFLALNSADATEWADIFASSSVTAPSTWGTNTNYPLLVLAFESLNQNLGESPLVIFTGDILGHYLAQTFYTLYGSQDQTAMAAFIHKTIAFFMGMARSYLGNRPVMFTVGNADSYTMTGPDSAFLADTAELYYTYFLNGTADYQTFLNTYTAGGYYSAEPLGNKLIVIGLNTNLLAAGIPGDNDNAVATQLAWLDSRLSDAQTAGKKVWLITHVPPGAVAATTAAQLDSNGHLGASNGSMMWQPTYQANFLEIVAKYPGLITLRLTGHTHMDEFRYLFNSPSPHDILDIVPGITPVFGNNPAYKIFTFAKDTFVPMDYRALNYDLSTLPAQFSADYTFSTAYSQTGPWEDSLIALVPTLVSNSATQDLFRSYYYAGNDSLNSITDANWPVYWCTIGEMELEGLVDCVNSY